MMSEKKRFILAEDSNGLFSIFDNEDLEDEPLIYGARFGTEKIVDLLNTQQATIDEQKIIIEERDVANERLNRFLIEIGLEKEYIKWEFKKGVLNE